MPIARETVAGKLAAYLRHEIPLAVLVDWAQLAIMEGEFEDIDYDAIRDAVARLGLGRCTSVWIDLGGLGGHLEAIGLRRSY